MAKDLFTKSARSRWYPAALGILGILVALLLVSRFEIQVWTGPSAPEDPINADPADPKPSTPAVLQPSPVPNLAESPPWPESENLPLPTAVPETEDSASSTENPAIPVGSLRVSNQTTHPLRVALLSSPSSAAETGDPVHWDFAPGEGRQQGLILSLPESDLQLQEGDILVAFAQDGSRRYWGPYVVGQTSFPAWSAQKAEWQLILQP